MTPKNCCILQFTPSSSLNSLINAFSTDSPISTWPPGKNNDGQYIQQLIIFHLLS